MYRCYQVIVNAGGNVVLKECGLQRRPVFAGASVEDVGLHLGGIASCYCVALRLVYLVVLVKGALTQVAVGRQDKAQIAALAELGFLTVFVNQVTELQIGVVQHVENLRWTRRDLAGRRQQRLFLCAEHMVLLAEEVFQ